MEIKITWHSDSISVCATAAEGPLTIQIHIVKLVRCKEQERPVQTRVYAYSYLLGLETPFLRDGMLGVPGVHEKPCK